MGDEMESRVNNLGITLAKLEERVEHTNTNVQELRTDGRNLVIEIRGEFQKMREESSQQYRELLKKFDEQTTATQQQITEARMSLQREMKEGEARMMGEIDTMRVRLNEHELFLTRVKAWAAPLGVVWTGILSAITVWLVSVFKGSGS